MSQDPRDSWDPKNFHDAKENPFSLSSSKNEPHSGTQANLSGSKATSQQMGAWEAVGNAWKTVTGQSKPSDDRYWDERGLTRKEGATIPQPPQERLKNSFDETLKALKENAFKIATEAKKKADEALQELRKKGLETLSSISQKAQQAKKIADEAIAKLQQAITEEAIRQTQILGDKALEMAKDALKEALHETKEEAKKAITNKANTFKKKVKRIPQQIKETTQKAWETTKKATQKGVKTVQKPFKSSPPKTPPVGGTAAQGKVKG